MGGKLPEASSAIELVYVRAGFNSSSIILEIHSTESLMAKPIVRKLGYLCQTYHRLSPSLVSGGSYKLSQGEMVKNLFNRRRFSFQRHLVSCFGNRSSNSKSGSLV